MAVGAKVENRLKLHKKAKLVSTLGRMTCNTRMGRENATAGQAELKLRLSDDQRSQVRHWLSLLHACAQRIHGWQVCRPCSQILSAGFAACGVRKFCLASLRRGAGRGE